MDELFLQQPYPQGRGKRTDMEHTPDHEDEAGSLEAEILDSHLIGSIAIGYFISASLFDLSLFQYFLN